MESLLETASQPNEGETTATAPEQQEQQPAGEQEQQQQEQQEQQQEEQQTEGAPEKYEFVAPEGREFDSEFLKVYEETARELNLPQDKAQKIIDKLSPVLEQRQAEKIEAVRQEWTDNSKADKEFGGDKLKENLGMANKALDQFGTPELKDFLKQTGLGNHPEVIRFFYRAGKAISPDTVVTGHKEGKADTNQYKTFNDYAERMYGS